MPSMNFRIGLLFRRNSSNGLNFFFSVLILEKIVVISFLSNAFQLISEILIIRLNEMSRCYGNALYMVKYMVSYGVGEKSCDG